MVGSRARQSKVTDAIGDALVASRLAIFVVLMLGSVVLGLVLYGRSKPVTVNLLVKASRPKIDVFVSDPRAAVRFTVRVGGLGTGGPHEAAVYATVAPPTPKERVFLLIFVQGDATGHFVQRVKDYFGVSGVATKTIPVFSASTALNPAGPETEDGHYLMTLKIPDVFRSSSGELQAQMPILNYLYLPGDAQFVAHGCELVDAGPNQPFAPDLVNWSHHRIPAPSCGPRSVLRSTQKVFYSPSRLTSRETLAVNTSGYQILENVPTGAGTAVAATAKWEGTSDLAPAITAVRPSLQEARSRNAFLAGIVLAIAGAALIAALQEVRRPKPGLPSPRADAASEPPLAPEPGPPN
jgi:hypothetical protein